MTPQAGVPSTGGRRVYRTQTRRPIETVIVNIVYFVFGVIEVLLAIRFGLLLFGANPEAGFTQFIYDVTTPFMAPFFAVFGTTEVRGAVFEWSALLAIAVYGLLAFGIAALVGAVTPRRSVSTVETEQETEADVTGQRPGV